MSFLNNKIITSLSCAFPTPKYLTFDTFAIDISSEAIRVMKLKKTKFGFVPKTFFEFKYSKPYNLYEEDFDISKNVEISNLMKKIRKEYSVKYAVASLPEIKTYIYRTKIPSAAASDIASAILFQVEDNVPLKLNEVNFDYHIIENSKISDIDVVVNVFPKKIIQTYADLLKQSDIFPLSFQSDSVALSRSVIKKGDNNPYLIIRILSNRITVSIIEDGAVQFATDFAVGSLDFEQGFENEKGDFLKESLNKILIYWFTNKKDFSEHRKIETAYIVGNLSTNPLLISFLEKSLKIKIETGNVWINCFSFNDYVPKLTRENALNYAVAIGLAIKSIEYA